MLRRPNQLDLVVLALGLCAATLGPAGLSSVPASGIPTTLAFGVPNASASGIPTTQASGGSHARASETPSTQPTGSGAPAADLPRRHVALDGPGASLIQRSGVVGYEKSQADTFYVYGGPGTLDGQFQDAAGNPDPQGWFGVDLTESVPYWLASTTNAQTLGGGVPGNHAAISHNSIASGGAYDGYGNAWNEWLAFRFDVRTLGIEPDTDASTVRWTCQFVHDTEPGWDFLHFDANIGGAYASLLAQDGSSYVESTSTYDAKDFDSDDFGGISYGPGQYVGDGLVVLRYRVTSDGAWSDEDGLWPTHGRGAAGVDDVAVWVNDQLVSSASFEPLDPENTDSPHGSLEGFDNGAGAGTEGWLPTSGSFAGDFAKIFSQFDDIDPCRSNLTPQWGFIDDGTPPNNARDGRSTGGSLSDNWSYGIHGGWVVNYEGGLTLGVEALDNQIWSPEIDWDLPGASDDDAHGAVLRFTRWSHLPLDNYIFATWSVRSYRGDVGWSTWNDNNFVYYGNSPMYGNFEIDVTEHLLIDPERIQISLAVVDLGGSVWFYIPDATPSPLYDNVALKKYEVGGPLITAKTLLLAGDGFPNDGTRTGSIRWDANVDTGPFEGALLPGDSIVVDILPLEPGSQLADPESGGVMKVAHLANPDFSFERQTGLSQLGAIGSGSDDRGWPIYTYEVEGARSTRNGSHVEDAYYFDLPDGPANVNASHQGDEPPLFFPGDVIHYYIEASDDQGSTATLPGNLSGFLDFGVDPPTVYDRVFIVRGLPTVSNGSQPPILFWNDTGHRGFENEYLSAFAQNGYAEGRHFDTYTTKAPTSLDSNGLGSTGHHGASPAQMAGYETLVYTSGNLGRGLICDGTDGPGSSKSDDVGLLTAWHAQDADRFHVYFGDDFADGMTAQGTISQDYVESIVGAQALAGDVSSAVDGQTAIAVLPTGLGPPCLGAGSLADGILAYGGCLVINDFDHVGPAPASESVSALEFTDPNGEAYTPSVAAGLWWDRAESGHRKVTAAFPFDLRYVRAASGWDGSGDGRSARAVLLAQILDCFDQAPTDPIVTPADPVPTARFALHPNHPNPFNPATTIRFEAPREGPVRLTIYNLRGEEVAVLVDGRVDPGLHEAIWRGTDDSGALVASGVYLYRLEGFGKTASGKMALIR